MYCEELVPRHVESLAIGDMLIRAAIRRVGVDDLQAKIRNRPGCLAGPSRLFVAVFLYTLCM